MGEMSRPDRNQHASSPSQPAVLLDNSLTCGGFHFSGPRAIYSEVRYRFKF